MSPKVKINDASVLCLSCATFFEPVRSKRSLRTCPHCSFAIDIDSYEELLQWGRQSAEIGYIYRDLYEDQVAKGKQNTYFCLQISDWYAWLALAALAGIVGNASYDLSKAAIRKIIGQLKRRIESNAELTTLNLLEEEPEITKFIDYVRQYPGFLKTGPREVTSALVGEIIAHRAAKVVASQEDIRSADFPEAIAEGLRDVLQTTERAHPDRKLFEKVKAKHE